MRQEKTETANPGWISYLDRKLRFHHWLPVFGNAKGVVVVLVSVSVAFIIRFWLRPWLGDELPFMLFTAAALIAAWYGGLALGILAAIMGLLLSDFFFLSPENTPHTVEITRLIRYVFTASLGVVLIELLHRSKRRTDVLLNELRLEMERRACYERELLEAKTELARHAETLETQVAERTASLTSAVASLQDLLHHIAHNLRAPLRAIDGFTALLVTEKKLQLDVAAQTYLGHISESAERMDTLIHDLLSYGRLLQLEIPLAAVSLERAVEEVLSQMSSQINLRNAEVRLLKPLPEVEAGAELLKQLLGEIIENALLFAAPGTVPHLLIWAELVDQAVRLWIEDNGIGIDPQYADRIFGAFEVLEPAHHQGTGIGLAIVKLGISRMRGRVGVLSQPGSGSRFWLELPVAQTSEKDAVINSFSTIESNASRIYSEKCITTRFDGTGNIMNGI